LVTTKNHGSTYISKTDFWKAAPTHTDPSHFLGLKCNVRYAIGVFQIKTAKIQSYGTGAGNLWKRISYRVNSRA